MRKLRHTIFFFFFISGQLLFSQDKFSVLEKVDSVVAEAIRAQAFPGCVIHVVKNEQVLLHKSYGYYTYDSAQKVEESSIYDIASITKVAGATLALMKMYEEGLYRLDESIGDYIPNLGRKVGNVTFREALAHQGGLYPWIPFHKEVRRKNGKYRRKTISERQDEEYIFPLSDSLFLHSDFYSRIKKMIRKSEVSKDKQYKYSGLFFYLVPELVHILTGETYLDYLRSNFYEPLGLNTMTFNPLMDFPINQIVPTEVDTFFRQELIHGKVHDEGAIMMEGVSGNAGLFSSSSDLVKLFQMLLNKGEIDSVLFLQEATIDLFTTAQYPGNGNRRGLGFDKPLLQYDSIMSSVAKESSQQSFGHTGYTGALAWADPKNQMIFVFLTNRVYPSRLQRAIYDRNVRPILHQLFYELNELDEGKKTDPVEKLK